MSVFVILVDTEKLHKEEGNGTMLEGWNDKRV